MDDIRTFLIEFSNRYPKSFLKIEKYGENFLPRDVKDPFKYDSNYIKRHILKNTLKGMEYIPIESAQKEDIKKSKGIFDLTLIDFEKLSTDLGINKYDVKDLCNDFLDNEIIEIRNFLFSCNKFKCYIFWQELDLELNEIEKDLDNIWDSFVPNWFQKEITLQLKENLKSLKSTIGSDITTVYPDITNSANKIKPSSTSPQIRHWQRIAELMANGIITINETGQYLFNGNIVLEEKRASELVSEYLDNEIKPQSIKPYLSRTKSNSKDDKNIFRDFRIKDLMLISAKADREDCLSEFFKKRLDIIIKETR